MQHLKKWAYFPPALYLYVLLTILSGCGIGTPLRTKSSFSYCFDGENTGLDSLINIDGFFYMKSKINENILLNESNIGYFYPSFVFYKKNFVHINPYYDLVFSKPKSSLHNFFDTHTRAEFGSYILNGDTIKIQLVEPPGGQTQDIYEVWFVIIDKYNMRPVYWGDPDLVSDKTVEEYIKKGPYRNETFTFYPMESKINPEKTWIYNKRWFKCNKN